MGLLFGLFAVEAAEREKSGARGVGPREGGRGEERREGGGGEEKGSAGEGGFGRGRGGGSDLERISMAKQKERDSFVYIAKVAEQAERYDGERFRFAPSGAD